MNESISQSVVQIFLDAIRWDPHDETFATPGAYDIDILDCTYILVCALIIFTMQTGFALVESGCVSRKNEVNIMLKNVTDCCFGGISYWAFGFGLMYGRGSWTNSFFGWGDFLLNPKIGDPLMGKIFTFFFYQMSFAQSATTIVSGACAERFYFPAYILFSFFNFFPYAIGAGWVWGKSSNLVMKLKF